MKERRREGRRQAGREGRGAYICIHDAGEGDIAKVKKQSYSDLLTENTPTMSQATQK